MATCSPSALVQAGKSFLDMKPQQSQAVMIALLCQILQAHNPMATCNVNDLMEDAKCFVCLPMPQQIAIQTQLLCEILEGGGAGQTCIVCIAADGSPTEVGPCDCSIAYNMIGQFWFWNSLTASWIPISV